MSETENKTKSAGPDASEKSVDQETKPTQASATEQNPQAGDEAKEVEVAGNTASAGDTTPDAEPNAGENAEVQAEAESPDLQASAEEDTPAPAPSNKSYAQLIESIDKPQMRELASFSVGDTVSVQIRVIEGERRRIQAFNGVVIAKRNRGLNSSFRVRKKSRDESVERVFQSHSPLIESVKVKTRGRVRRAKLYYLRKLSGLAARIEEKIK